MNNFTFEEINLMCIYNSGDGTRQELIEALTEMRGYLGADETELLELTDSALKKLSAMTDEAFVKRKYRLDIKNYTSSKSGYSSSSANASSVMGDSFARAESVSSKSSVSSAPR